MLKQKRLFQTSSSRLVAELQGEFQDAAAENFLKVLCLKVRSRRNRKRANNFFLQNNFGFILEEISLSVAAGLDVLPAISKVVQVNKEVLGCSKEATDFNHANEMLDEILQQTYQGISFVDAVQDLVKTKDLGLISTALMHLALAHKVGGELVSPLQDLSDAFQDLLQDEYERQINSMPIKATFPLLLIFAGMIIVSVGLPILKVLDASKSNIVEAR